MHLVELPGRPRHAAAKALSATSLETNLGICVTVARVSLYNASVFTAQEDIWTNRLLPAKKKN
jgi:hypothetical protein